MGFKNILLPRSQAGRLMSENDKLGTDIKIIPVKNLTEAIKAYS